MFSCSGNLATMACGLPYAMAAAVAYPGRHVIAFVGDGGLTMLMGELATCVKYNLDQNHCHQEQRPWPDQVGADRLPRQSRNTNATCSRSISPASPRRAAPRATSIDDAGRCADTLREALAAPGPALIEAVVDPNEPPMPPGATLKDAAHFAEALIKGTPHAADIARTVASNVVREMV